MTTSPPITLSVDGQHGSIAAQAAGRREAEELLYDDEIFEDDILVSYCYFIKLPQYHLIDS